MSVRRILAYVRAAPTDIGLRATAPTHGEPKRLHSRGASHARATCDEAGAGDGLTDRLVRHSQRNRGATRQPATLPF